MQLRWFSCSCFILTPRYYIYSTKVVVDHCYRHRCGAPAVVVRGGATHQMTSWVDNTYNTAGASHLICSSSGSCKWGSCSFFKEGFFIYVRCDAPAVVVRGGAPAVVVRGGSLAVVVRGDAPAVVRCDAPVSLID